jgi:hypothetical protein
MNCTKYNHLNWSPILNISAILDSHMLVHYGAGCEKCCQKEWEIQMVVKFVWHLRFAWQCRYRLSSGLWHCELVAGYQCFRRVWNLCFLNGRYTWTMRPGGSSESLVTTYQRIWCHNLEDRILNLQFRSALVRTDKQLGPDWPWPSRERKRERAHTWGGDVMHTPTQPPPPPCMHALALSLDGQGQSGPISLSALTNADLNCRFKMPSWRAACSCPSIPHPLWMVEVVNNAWSRRKYKCLYLKYVYIDVLKSVLSYYFKT